jgi:hypothetical protein
LSPKGTGLEEKVRVRLFENNRDSGLKKGAAELFLEDPL